MDILKKMFSGSDKNQEKPEDKFKDEFKKPNWFDDDDIFENKNFNFEMFTDPLELEKHFEKQIKEILRSVQNFDEDEDEDTQQHNDNGYFKPGFKEDLFKKFMENPKPMDTDFDDEIFKDQLHAFVQSLSPNKNKVSADVLNQRKKKNQKKIVNQEKKPKLSDEETIMRMIHGTLDNENDSGNKLIEKRKNSGIHKNAPQFGGVFEGNYQGPKIFGQSIITQTVRKPDGSYETKKIFKDSNGNVKTTITRTIDGKTEIIKSFENDGQKQNKMLKTFKDSENKSFTNDSVKQINSDKNIYVSKDGYALPVNFW